MAERFATFNYINIGRPTIDDDIDAGFCIGDTWVDSDDGTTFSCISNIAGAAQWVIAIGGDSGVVSDASTTDTDQGTPAVDTWYITETGFTVVIPVDGIYEVFLRSRFAIRWTGSAFGVDLMALVIGLGTSITPGNNLFWTHHLGGLSLDTDGEETGSDVSYNGLVGRFAFTALDNIYLNIHAKDVAGGPALDVLGVHNTSFGGAGTGLLEARLLEPT